MNRPAGAKEDEEDGKDGKEEEETAGRGRQHRCNKLCTSGFLRWLYCNYKRVPAWARSREKDKGTGSWLGSARRGLAGGGGRPTTLS